MKRLILFFAFIVLPNIGFGQICLEDSFLWDYIPINIDDWKKYNGDQLYHIYISDMKSEVYPNYDYHNIWPLEHNGSIRSIVCRQMSEEYKFGEATLKESRRWSQKFDSSGYLIDNVVLLHPNKDHYTIPYDPKFMICNVQPNTKERTFNRTRLEYSWENGGQLIKVQMYYNNRLYNILHYEYIGKRLKLLNVYNKEGVKQYSLQFTYTDGNLLSEMKFFRPNVSKPEVVKRYRYDDRGNIIYYSYLENPISEFLTEIKITNTYDTKGNISKMSILRTYSSAGSRPSVENVIRTYEYDSHNNWIKAMEKDDSNNLRLMYIREFEY